MSKFKVSLGYRAWLHLKIATRGLSVWYDISMLSGLASERLVDFMLADFAAAVQVQHGHKLDSPMAEGLPGENSKEIESKGDWV